MPKTSSRQCRSTDIPPPEGCAMEKAAPDIAGREELISLVEEAIDRRFNRLFADLEALSPGHGPGRGHTSLEKAVKFTVSMPRELYAQLKAMDGTVSSHVSAAVQLYLSARKAAGGSR